MEYNAGHYITKKMKSGSLVSVRKKSKVDDMNFGKNTNTGLHRSGGTGAHKFVYKIVLPAIRTDYSCETMGQRLLVVVL